MNTQIAVSPIPTQALGMDVAVVAGILFGNGEPQSLNVYRLKQDTNFSRPRLRYAIRKGKNFGLFSVDGDMISLTEPALQHHISFHSGE